MKFIPVSHTNESYPHYHFNKNIGSGPALCGSPCQLTIIPVKQYLESNEIFPYPSIYCHFLLAASFHYFVVNVMTSNLRNSLEQEVFTS